MPEENQTEQELAKVETASEGATFVEAVTALDDWRAKYCRGSELSRDTIKLNRVSEFLDAIRRELI